MKLSESVKRVIDLSNAVKQEVEARQQEPMGRPYDPSRERLGPTEAERSLHDYLLEQPVAVIYTLTLIMYAGRGDFPIENFMEQYGEMHELFDTPAQAVGQMTEKVHIPCYLEDGLRLLANQGTDVDDLLGK